MADLASSPSLHPAGFEEAATVDYVLSMAKRAKDAPGLASSLEAAVRVGCQPHRCASSRSVAPG